MAGAHRHERWRSHPIGTFAIVSIREITATGRALRACGTVVTDDD
jgi:hypothetical protein